MGKLVVQTFPAPKEICRMSWFLVKLEFPGSPQKTFVIIHAVDIVGDLTSIYLNRSVTFNRDHKSFNGIVVCASDNRKTIEVQCKQKVEEQLGQYRQENLYLVQSSDNEQSVNFNIVKKSEITWIADRSNRREVFVHRQGDIQRLGVVLQCGNDESKLVEDMEGMKKKCFQMFFEDARTKSDPQLYPWMLVQYSQNNDSVVHAIVNESETVWKQENMYRDIVAYVSDSKAIFQAVIIKKSSSKTELLYVMEKIKECCVTRENENNENCIDLSKKERIAIQNGNSERVPLTQVVKRNT
ncbi:hypothetical protein ACFFRR_003261 [Megaselia abdita]